MKTAVLLLVCAAVLLAKDRATQTKPSALDRYLAGAEAQPKAPAASAGSLWTSSSPMAGLGSDLRARRLHDALTIVVVDRASAVAKGTVKSSRAASASGGVNAAAGRLSPGGALPNLLELGSNRQLEGEGETSRETLLRTTLSARVIQVLPNGDLVVAGSKSVRINSEAQTVEVRGIVRPYDISPSNTVLSDQLSFLEVSVDGKGVVNDAVRRPNFLYRLLLGLLPF